MPAMRGFRDDFKVSRYLKSRRAVSNCGKRPKQIALTAMVLILTVSIVFTGLQTIKKTAITDVAIPNAETTMTNGTSLWNQTYGEPFPNNEHGRCVRQTADGGYIITGNTHHYSDNPADDYYNVLLIKTDANGNEVWYKTFGGTYYDEAYCVEQTSDGGYIVVGYTQSYSAGWDSDVWLIKTDANGNEEWNKTYEGTGDEEGRRVLQHSDGGYIITGSTSANVLLIKTDENGDEMWNKTYEGTVTGQGYWVEQTADGGYIITGETDSYDVLLIKTNSTGDEEWSKIYEVQDEDTSWCVKQTADGGYIMAGHTASDMPFFDYDGWLMKTDENGNEVWNKTFEGESDDHCYYVEKTSDGGFIMTGTIRAYYGGPLDLWLIKTDENGTQIWNQTYGGDNSEYGFCVEQTSDGGYIMIGDTSSYGAGGDDVWLIKTDEAGSGAPVIDHPADITYDEGSSGYNIIWHPSDANPSDYIVMRDFTIVINGSWDGGSIIVNVSGLSHGTYTYTCLVTDLTGYNNSDSVTVTVTTAGIKTDLFTRVILAMLILALGSLYLFARRKRKGSFLEEAPPLPIPEGELSKKMQNVSSKEILFLKDLGESLGVNENVLKNFAKDMLQNGVLHGVLIDGRFVSVEYARDRIQELFSFYDRIGWETLMDVFMMDKVEDLKSLIFLVGLAGLPIKMDEVTKSVRLADEAEIVEKPPNTLYCPYCGAEIHAGATSCENCLGEFQKCIVCNLSIPDLDELTKTPCCKTYAHRAHLKEWLKIKGKCPNCGKKLEEWETP